MFFSKLFKQKFHFRFNPDAVFEQMVKYLYNLKSNSRIMPPLRLFVYPTALCNDRCKYCSDGTNIDSEEQKKALNYNKSKDFFSNRSYIDKLIKDIRELRIRDLHLFGGGEPFFYKENMFYFLERIKNLDIFIRIITNANNLNDEDIERIVKERLVSQLNISLNTGSKKTAEEIYLDSNRHLHTVGVLESITKFKAMYQTEFPKVDIMFTLMSVNYNTVLEIINLLKGHKINYFMFQPLRVYSDKQKSFLLTPAQEKEFLKEVPRLEKRLEELNIFSNMNIFKSNAGSGSASSIQYPKALELKNKNNLILKCYIYLTTFSICYNGNMPFCQFRYDKFYRQNYFDIDSLKEFFRGDEYKSLVNSFINGEVPDICQECNFCVPHELEQIRKRCIHFSQQK